VEIGREIVTYRTTTRTPARIQDHHIKISFIVHQTILEASTKKENKNSLSSSDFSHIQTFLIPKMFFSCFFVQIFLDFILQKEI